jgi:ribosomal protein S18 acetylase RimI-like enzyme
VIHYRTFRNNDPPGLVEVWNEAFTGRAAVRMHGCTWMEYFLFSKIYFDPESIFIACDDNRIVGFASTGFGPNETENALDFDCGVLCLLGVLPSHRRCGIGSELLRRAEEYLCRRGGKQVFAGPMYPLNPYTFGIYGGSSSPGFLDSDPLARTFLERRGYAVENTCLVLQRSVQNGFKMADGRFAAHRLRYEVHTNPFQGTTWWQECILGPIELHEYRLKDKLTGHTAARALLWEMETYRELWGKPAIGITDVAVPSELRRQGLAKFLMAQLLRYLQDQFYSLVEIQVRSDNVAALSLMQSLGFESVDSGHIYQRL